MEQLLSIQAFSAHSVPGCDVMYPTDRLVSCRDETHSDKEDEDLTEEEDEEETEETGGEEEESEGDEEEKQEQDSPKQAEIITYFALGDFAAQQAGDLTFKVGS